MKLPRLYSARQYAAKLGVSFSTFTRWLRAGRVPDAQLLPCGWVIPEGATIRVKYTDIDLPPEFILGEINPLDEPKYKGNKGNAKGVPKRKVEASGFKTVRESLGLTKTQITKITGVSRDAQLRMERGERVLTKTVRKIAVGLDVTIEELLRKPMYIPEGYN